MRYFRIAIALFCFYTAYEQNQWIFIPFGIFFLFQAIFNLACKLSGCNIPLKKRSISKFQELINGNKPVLIDPFSNWCIPCNTLAPILLEVKEELKEVINIIKVDVD